MKLFVAGCPVINALMIAYLPAHQKIHQPFIGHQRVDLRAVVNGIAALSFRQMPIVMQKETDITRMSCLVGYFDAPQQERTFGVNSIMRSEEHTSELQSRFDLVC